MNSIMSMTNLQINDRVVVPCILYISLPQRLGYNGIFVKKQNIRLLWIVSLEDVCLFYICLKFDKKMQNDLW